MSPLNVADDVVQLQQERQRKQGGEQQAREKFKDALKSKARLKPEEELGMGVVKTTLLCAVVVALCGVAAAVLYDWLVNRGHIDPVDWMQQRKRG